MNITESTITLWGTVVSPFVRKAYVALKEKGLDFKVNQTLPTVLLTALKQEIPETFADASLLGRIPALQDNSTSVADSAVIVAYLERQYPNTKNLYPSDNASFARALWFENYADHVFAKVVYEKIFLEAFVKPKVLGIKPDQELIDNAIQQELPVMLSFLEKQLLNQTWFVGNELTVADIAIASHFVSLNLVGFDLPKKEFPNLSKFVERMLSRPAFQEALSFLNV